jgi:hypothetical protein
MCEKCCKWLFAVLSCGDISVVLFLFKDNNASCAINVTKTIILCFRM